MESDLKDKVRMFYDKGIIISPDMAYNLEKLKMDDIEKLGFDKNMIYVNNDSFSFSDGQKEINWTEFEEIKAISEVFGDEKQYLQLVSYFKSVDSEKSEVKIIKSYNEFSEKREVSDFSMYFNARLSQLQKILFSRPELKSTLSISRIVNKSERESVSLIGMVKDKQITKNNNIMLTLEDSTADIKVLVNKNKPDIYEIAMDAVLDEVMGVVGVSGGNIVFANNVVLPDVPQLNELKKSGKEGYALFLSDLHIGSNNFLEDDFNRFLKWLNQETGSEAQKKLASLVKYIFIVGDLVDGVGIYPNQEEELVIDNVHIQYNKCAELLSKIPININVIICGGNHDALRIAEPQPPLYMDFCESLHKLPNVTITSNPAIVNIHSSDDFSGYDILMYHGYSFDYYVANVDSIRNGGGYDRADLIMKFLLKRRHLAPTHTSTLYVPYSNMDPLVIDTVPDFFITGHIHKTAVSNYKNITLISGSCWQSKTAFQAKMGHHPEPSRVPIVNLATREVKILRFGK